MQPQELRVLVGRNVRRRRQELKLTQAVLADRLNVAQSYISALEKGKKSPLLETIASLADALEVPPSYLLAGSVPVVPSTVPGETFLESSDSVLTE